MRHTPGPWKIGPHQVIQSVGWSIRIPKDDSAIAYVLGERNPELRANANLIAAAPGLLSACERMMVGITKQDTENCEWYEGIEFDGAEEAKAAIAKAEGGKP